MTDTHDSGRPACKACRAWFANTLSGWYAADCEECSARQVAGSPEAWRWLKQNDATGLRALTARTFKPDRYELGRELVKAWIKRWADARLCKPVEPLDAKPDARP